MKVVVQRVKRAAVKDMDSVLDGAHPTSSVGKGMVLLVCLEKGDGLPSLERASDKIANLRIFENLQTGKMDENITTSQAEILSISQFTLSWDGKKGNRPSFDLSMPPSEALPLFEKFCHLLQEKTNRCVNKGFFGKRMEVEIIGDGPVTFHFSF